MEGHFADLSAFNAALALDDYNLYSIMLDGVEVKAGMSGSPPIRFDTATGTDIGLEPSASDEGVNGHIFRASELFRYGSDIKLVDVVVDQSTAVTEIWTLIATGTGQITGVIIGDHGAGYSGVPTVSFAGGAGADAAGTAVMGKTVATVSLGGGGHTYAGVPVIGFVGGSPDFPALGHAEIANGVVTRIVVDFHGVGYETTPTVAITPLPGDPGAGATATASMSTSDWTVKRVDMTNLGTTYTGLPVIGFSGSPARAATGVAVFEGDSGVFAVSGSVSGSGKDATVGTPYTDGALQFTLSRTAGPTTKAGDIIQVLVA